MRGPRRIAVVLASALAPAGCGAFTDPATRLAYDIEEATSRMGREDGATTTLVHPMPSRAGECTGPYRVQLDEADALVVWCYDGTGKTVSSHGTTYHRRFTETERTLILTKPAGSPLRIRFERRSGRPVIVAAS